MKLSNRGFTLIELMVVIGIAVVFMAMGVGAVMHLLRGPTEVVQCTMQLQKIGQAMKEFYADHGAVPAVYVIDGTDAEEGALNALLTGDYLSRKKPTALHCPKDILPDTTESYSGPDEAVTAASMLNRYRYMPCREGALGGAWDMGANVRQLSPFWEVEDYGEGWAWLPAAKLPPPPGKYFGLRWHPDDDTVVTWCDRHLEKTDGKYLVLFWSGAIVRIPAGFFDGRHPDAPAEAWMVTPDMAKEVD